MLAISRLLYVLILPVAGCVLLAEKGAHLKVGWVLLIVLAIFIYHYLQCALIVTEKNEKPSVKGLLLGVVPIILVGLSASFSWKVWIIEQMFLEAGTFSLGVALIAVKKGIREGREAPWGAVVIVFLLPALTLVYFAGSAVLRMSEKTFGEAGPVFLIAALAVAVSDTVRRLYPYVLGSEQLSEPIQKGWQMVFTVVWLLGLLIGLPLILMPPGS